MNISVMKTKVMRIAKEMKVGTRKVETNRFIEIPWNFNHVGWIFCWKDGIL